jgi:transposase
MGDNTGKIEEYLRHLLAIQLYQAGASQRDIAKHLRASLSTVGVLLKGIERGQKNDEEAKP